MPKISLTYAMAVGPLEIMVFLAPEIRGIQTPPFFTRKNHGSFFGGGGKGVLIFALLGERWSSGFDSIDIQ